MLHNSPCMLSILQLVCDIALALNLCQQKGLGGGLQDPGVKSNVKIPADLLAKVDCILDQSLIQVHLSSGL